MQIHRIANIHRFISVAGLMALLAITFLGLYQDANYSTRDNIFIYNDIHSWLVFALVAVFFIAGFNWWASKRKSEWLGFMGILAVCTVWKMVYIISDLREASEPGDMVSNFIANVSNALLRGKQAPPPWLTGWLHVLAVLVPALLIISFLLLLWVRRSAVWPECSQTPPQKTAVYETHNPAKWFSVAGILFLVTFLLSGVYKDIHFKEGFFDFDFFLTWEMYIAALFPLSYFLVYFFWQKISVQKEMVGAMAVMAGAAIIILGSLLFYLFADGFSSKKGGRLYISKHEPPAWLNFLNEFTGILMLVVIVVIFLMLLRKKRPEIQG